MKDKIFFIISIVLSILITLHLFIIGFTCNNEIVFGTFENGNVSSINKVSLMIYISLLMIFALLVIIPTYIKEKHVNYNLFMFYLILEIVLNVLPYFNI